MERRSFSRIPLAVLLLFAVPRVVDADSPRTKLAGPPRLHDREVPELILLGPVHAGRELPPGLPTTMTFQMLPNRFVAVSEDRDGIYYQAVGRVHARGGPATGGLYASKMQREVVVVYLGDARHPHARLSMIDRLQLKDLRKLKTGHAAP